jgi:hypothetical protein
VTCLGDRRDLSGAFFVSFIEVISMIKSRYPFILVLWGIAHEHIKRYALSHHLISQNYRTMSESSANNFDERYHLNLQKVVEKTMAAVPIDFESRYGQGETMRDQVKKKVQNLLINFMNDNSCFRDDYGSKKTEELRPSQLTTTINRRSLAGLTPSGEKTTDPVYWITCNLSCPKKTNASYSEIVQQDGEIPQDDHREPTSEWERGSDTILGLSSLYVCGQSIRLMNSGQS